MPGDHEIRSSECREKAVVNLKFYVQLNYLRGRANKIFQAYKN